MRNNELFRVDEIEAISFDENGKEDGTWKGFSVVKIGDEANYCFDCRDKLNADKLCDFLNHECIIDDVEDTSIEAFVLDNCIEWYNLMSDVSKKEKQLYMKKEEYSKREFEIMFIEDINFKELYGSTAEKVRKQHAKTELKELGKEIKDLELSIEYCKKRISYLKGLVTVKTALMEVKSND